MPKFCSRSPGCCHGVQRQVGQQRLRRRLGRLPRAQQVAAHQVLHTKPLSQQPLRHAASLLHARGVQRHVHHLTLKAQLAVPVGFAVADGVSSVMVEWCCALTTRKKRL